MSTPEQPDQPQNPSGSNPSGPPSYGSSQPGGAPQYGGPSAYGSGQPPQAPQAPQYGATPGYSAPQQDPGKTMGIVGLILSFLGCLSIVGLILSIVALNKSKKAGYKNGIAIAGIIVGSLVLIGTVIAAIVIGVAAGNLAEVCSDLGPGTHYENGVTYTCS